MRYSKDHCCIEKTETGVKIGLTEYLHSKICNNFEINLCDEGDRVRAGDIIGDIESCDFFDIISPVSGTVVRVNDEALDNPQLILKNNPWLIEMTDVAFTQQLMSENEYNVYLKNLK
ncbi:MAG: glycine cleavage system protein H [Clostridia bacterium]|nr:glycine cleavage system protein H [Clostridia bacterium]